KGGLEKTTNLDLWMGMSKDETEDDGEDEEEEGQATSYTVWTCWHEFSKTSTLCYK
ncbi:hypothetical protein ACJX0J_040179, partial [Zea mays]